MIILCICVRAGSVLDVLLANSALVEETESVIDCIDLGGLLITTAMFN